MRKTRQRVSFKPEVMELEGRVVPSVTNIYVDANIAAHSTQTVHDGSTWAKAFNNLQSALAKASSTSGADVIWIAQGTYTPSLAATSVSGSTGNNMKTFDLPNNVSLYGGLTYGMTSLAQRNPAAYPTILSGDLNGNDIANPADPGYAASKADNAWHVVTLGNDITKEGVTATLDGLTIVGGYANGPDSGGNLSPFVYGHSDGGGVYSAFGSNLTLNNDVFKNDVAANNGGGVFSDGSNLTVTNTVFLNNAGYSGGALYGINDFEIGSHTSTLVNDYFQDNTAQIFGGAIVGEGAYQGPNSAMSMDDCTFIHNQAAEGGAAVFDTLTVTITDSSFNNNIGTVNAGAIATTNVVGTIDGAPNDFATTISDSSFVNNVCVADPAAHTALNNFSGPGLGINFAFGGGALVTYMNGYLNVDNDVFIHNVAQNSDGGAILNGNASAVNVFGSGISAFAVQTQITDSLFIDNVAQNGNGGAIASETDGLAPTSTVAATALTVKNSVFLGNQAAANGGAIYLNTSTATITGNAFGFDEASQSNGVYGQASQVDGFATSDPLALKALKKTNAFVGDDNDLS